MGLCVESSCERGKGLADPMQPIPDNGCSRLLKITGGEVSSFADLVRKESIRRYRAIRLRHSGADTQQAEDVIQVGRLDQVMIETYGFSLRPRGFITPGSKGNHFDVLKARCLPEG